MSYLLFTSLMALNNLISTDVPLRNHLLSRSLFLLDCKSCGDDHDDRDDDDVMQGEIQKKIFGGVFLVGCGCGRGFPTSQ